MMLMDIKTKRHGSLLETQTKQIFSNLGFYTIPNYNLKGYEIDVYARFTRHKKLLGTPDFFLKKFNIVLFIDGCFWHGCPKCYRKPKHNAIYWVLKVKNNRKRDRKVNSVLKGQGINVIRVWEHELKNPRKLVKKISKKMGL